jgi:hypothetical protein
MPSLKPLALLASHFFFLPCLADYLSKALFYNTSTCSSSAMWYGVQIGDPAPRFFSGACAPRPTESYYNSTFSTITCLNSSAYTLRTFSTTSACEGMPQSTRIMGAACVGQEHPSMPISTMTRCITSSASIPADTATGFGSATFINCPVSGALPVPTSALSAATSLSPAGARPYMVTQGTRLSMGAFVAHGAWPLRFTQTITVKSCCFPRWSPQIWTLAGTPPITHATNHTPTQAKSAHSSAFHPRLRLHLHPLHATTQSWQSPYPSQPSHAMLVLCIARVLLTAKLSPPPSHPQLSLHIPLPQRPGGPFATLLRFPAAQCLAVLYSTLRTLPAKAQLEVCGFSVDQTK